MNSRTIRIKSYTDIESLKKFILQQLSLAINTKKAIAQFDEQLVRHLSKNPQLKLIVQFDRDRLQKDIRSWMSLQSRPSQPFPENFDMGNPHNRWFYDPIVKTQEEIRREEAEFERSFQEKIARLNAFLHDLAEVGNGRITIKDRRPNNQGNSDHQDINLKHG